jgi:large-conductance mechanosensitive channel
LEGKQEQSTDYQQSASEATTSVTPSNSVEGSHTAICVIIEGVVGGIISFVIVAILIFFNMRKTSKVSHQRENPDCGAPYSEGQAEYMEQLDGRLDHGTYVENPGGKLGKGKGIILG